MSSEDPSTSQRGFTHTKEELDEEMERIEYELSQIPQAYNRALLKGNSPGQFRVKHLRKIGFAWYEFVEARVTFQNNKAYDYLDQEIIFYRKDGRVME